MDPGLEFKVAMEEAERLPAKLIYGDADQDHTMRRISENFSMQVLISFPRAFLFMVSCRDTMHVFCAARGYRIEFLMCLIFRPGVRLSAGCMEDAHGRAEDPCRCHGAHERFQGRFKRPGGTGEILTPKLQFSATATSSFNCLSSPDVPAQHGIC